MPVIHYIELLPLRDSTSSCADGRDYICRLSLRGCIGIDGAHETGVLLASLLAGGIKRFILNMENLNYIDSTGIGMIIKAKKNLSGAGGDLVLYNVPPKVNEALELVNLKDYIKIFYAEAKAYEHLRRC